MVRARTEARDRDQAQAACKMNASSLSDLSTTSTGTRLSTDRTTRKGGPGTVLRMARWTPCWSTRVVGASEAFPYAPAPVLSRSAANETVHF